MFGILVVVWFVIFWLAYCFGWGVAICLIYCGLGAWVWCFGCGWLD